MNEDEEFVKSRIFLGGDARFNDLLYILSKDKSLHENDVSHTSAIAIDAGDWANVVDAKWDSTAIAVAKQPDEKLVFIGEDGGVITYVGGKSTKEQLKPQPLLIRRAKSINGYVYACGMGRQLYRRIAENKWLPMNALEPKDGERTGFEGIDGFSEDEIYCCGWNGEIWYFNGSDWLNHSDITNLILTSICCAGDDQVYIVGQQGLLIKGRYDSWEVVDLEEEFPIDFWDVHWFNGKLYITTMTGLYTLENNTLHEIEFSDVLNTTFYRLTSAEGVLWSIGSSDVLSFDGKQWERHS